MATAQVQLLFSRAPKQIMIPWCLKFCTSWDVSNISNPVNDEISIHKLPNQMVIAGFLNQSLRQHPQNPWKTEESTFFFKCNWKTLNFRGFQVDGKDNEPQLSCLNHILSTIFGRNQNWRPVHFFPAFASVNNASNESQKILLRPCRMSLDLGSWALSQRYVSFSRLNDERG